MFCYFRFVRLVVGVPKHVTHVVHFCSSCRYQRVWVSSKQLRKPSTYAMNVAVYTAVVLSGSQFYKLRRLSDSLGLQMLNGSSFHVGVKKFVYPTIRVFYNTMQDLVFEELRDQPITAKGDGQAVLCISVKYSLAATFLYILLIHKPFLYNK